MKKLLLLISFVLIGNFTIAQDNDPLFLLFEFMRVDNSQESAYAETEEFWEKIHVQRVKNGDCIGWDLWSLQPSGEDQEFQYMTVSLYNDPAKMMDGGDFGAAYNAAYPNMTDEDSAKWMEKTSNSRDLVVRVYLEMVENISAEDFDMPVGSIAIMNFMKAKPGQAMEYEKMEREVFMPMHQQQIDAGGRASWGVMRNMLWYASDTYASHITFDMFTSYDQMFNGADGGDGTPMTEEQQKAINDGLATRDLRMVKHARLLRKVRAETAQ